MPSSSNEGLVYDVGIEGSINLSAPHCTVPSSSNEGLVYDGGIKGLITFLHHTALCLQAATRVLCMMVGLKV